MQALPSQQDTVDAAGIAFGSVVACPADTSVFANNTGVSIIPEASNPATLTLNQTHPEISWRRARLSRFTSPTDQAARTAMPSLSLSLPTWTGSDPFFQFNLQVKGAVTNSPTVKFDHSDGIAVGMTMTSASGVPANTTVIAVPDGTSITLSNNVSLADNAPVTFRSNLSSGIVQHVEVDGHVSARFRCPSRRRLPPRSFR